jgi:GDP-fucose protein O-fucosyltransferase
MVSKYIYSLFFEDESVQKITDRFVRDYVHYTDEIFCKAALIINSLFKEGMGRGYSSFHIRRGDFQYKVVKVSAEVMLANVGHLFNSDELIYIATDEKNASFFDPFRAKFPKVCTIQYHT